MLQNYAASHMKVSYQILMVWENQRCFIKLTKFAEPQSHGRAEEWNNTGSRAVLGWCVTPVLWGVLEQLPG